MTDLDYAEYHLCANCAYGKLMSDDKIRCRRFKKESSLKFHPRYKCDLWSKKILPGDEDMFEEEKK